MRPILILLVSSLITWSAVGAADHHRRPATDGGVLTAQLIRLITDRYDEADGGLTVQEALERSGGEERMSNATRKLLGR